jgi:HSP20 family protein
MALKVVQPERSEEDTAMQGQKRWDPFQALARMDREFDELVRRGWPVGAAPAVAGGAQLGFVPAVEVARDGADVVVRLELPGVDVERDVAIEVDRGSLVISGERRDTRPDGAAGVLVRELRYGSFRREFALPTTITADDVEAAYDAGLLDIRVRGVIAPEPQAVRVPIKAAGPVPAAVTGEAAGEPAT